MRTQKLGEFIEKWHVKKDDWEGSKKLEVLGVSNVDGITVTSHKKSKDLSKYLVIEPNCFAYNPYRINVGSIGLTPEETYGLVSPAYTVFKVKENKLIPELLLDFLKSFDGLQQINKYARGTVRKALRYDDLCEIKVNFPSYEEQKIIFNKKLLIEKKQTVLSKEIHSQKQLISQLKQAILQEAIQGKLTQEWREKNLNTEPASELLERIKSEKEQLIKNKKLKKGKTINHPRNLIELDSFPSSWEQCKADDILFVTKLAGFEYSKHITLQETGEIPVIRAQNVRPLEVDKSSLLYIDKKTSELLERCSLSKKCLLVTFIGAGIGDVATFNENKRWHLAPNVAKMEPFEGCEEFIDIKFLNYYLLSPIGRKEIFKHIKATAQPSLSMGTIRDIDFPIPPIQEQKEIVEKVETLMQKCNALEQEITQSEEHANMLMQAVLKEAFESNNRHFHKTYKQTGDYIQEQTLSDLFPTQNLYAEVACMLSIEKEMHRKSRGKTWVQKTANHLKEIKKEPKLKDVIFEEYPWGMFSQTIAIAIDSNPFLTIDDVAGVSVYKVRFNKIAELNLWMQEPRNADFVASTRNIVSLYDDPLINNDLNRIELLNTVYRCVQKLNTTDFELIYQAMREWPMQEQGFANKSEKFEPYETKLMIGVIEKFIK